MIEHVQAALSRGFHVFRLKARSKEPLSGSRGFKDASGEPSVMRRWEYALDGNIGIATGESGLTVLDFDSMADIPTIILNADTYKVSTARGLHVYFRGTRRSGKLVLDGEHLGEIKSLGGYVLAAGSVHPSGERYRVFDDSPIAQMPQEIERLLGVVEEPAVNANSSGPKIPYGSHELTLFRIAAKLRDASLDADLIEPLLVRICERRCVGYGSDYRQMCARIARNVERRYAAGCEPTVPVPFLEQW